MMASQEAGLSALRDTMERSFFLSCAYGILSPPLSGASAFVVCGIKTVGASFFCSGDVAFNLTLILEDYLLPTQELYHGRKKTVMFV